MTYTKKEILLKSQKSFHFTTCQDDEKTHERSRERLRRQAQEALILSSQEEETLIIYSGGWLWSMEKGLTFTARFCCIYSLIFLTHFISSLLCNRPFRIFWGCALRRISHCLQISVTKLSLALTT